MYLINYHYQIDTFLIFLFILIYRYVIVENMRYLLTAYNSSDPIFLGCKFKPYVKQGYMSGGAGN